MKVNNRAALLIVTLILISGPSVAKDESGLESYRANCLACHQADGGGVPFMQPALVGSARVRGTADELIDFVIQGTINRGSDWHSDYNNAMLAFGYLDNVQLASVLSYIRETFGEGAGEIFPSDIERVRAR